MASPIGRNQLQDTLNESHTGVNRRSRSPSYDSLFGGSNTPLEFDEFSDSQTPETPATENTTYPSQNDPTYGLKWVRDGFSSRPVWTIEPTIEAIVATLEKAIDSKKSYHVKHIHDGTYSKLYQVSYDQQHFVMRVSLPVCPATQTESEVATLAWVYQNSNMPVPLVKCYDSSARNPLGFEWILMDRMDGVPLSQCWWGTTFGAKERIVKQIAAYAASVFEKQFSGGIGNIYSTSRTSPAPGFRIGEMVRMEFF